MKTKKNINLYDLEYSKLEKAEIITHLNKLLASYQIYFQKLRNFSWNLVGQDYFDLYQKFRELADKAHRNIDEIAGRIRIFDQTPVNLLNECIQLSDIKENGLNLAGFEMVKEIISDMLLLLSIKGECVRTAIEFGDYGTEKLVKDLIHEMEKEHQVLLSWLK